MNPNLSACGAAIRQATAADIAEIVRVTNAAYVVEQFCLQGDRTDAADVAERMRSGRFLVIDDPAQAGALRGLVYLSIEADRGYLGTLSVDPAHQGTGLAKALVSEIEECCQREDLRFLDISVVNLRKELFPFYAKLGFSPVATLPFPRPDKALRSLHLVQLTKALRAPEDL
jgi:GNAT superfamily N-acetyltransferase